MGRPFGLWNAYKFFWHGVRKERLKVGGSLKQSKVWLNVVAQHDTFMPRNKSRCRRSLALPWAMDFLIFES